MGMIAIIRKLEKNIFAGKVYFFFFADEADEFLFGFVMSSSALSSEELWNTALLKLLFLSSHPTVTFFEPSSSTSVTTIAGDVLPNAARRTVFPIRPLLHTTAISFILLFQILYYHKRVKTRLIGIID
jgi:hypothetical protein